MLFSIFRGNALDRKFNLSNLIIAESGHGIVLERGAISISVGGVVEVRGGASIGWGRVASLVAAAARIRVGGAEKIVLSPTKILGVRLSNSRVTINFHIKLQKTYYIYSLFLISYFQLKDIQ